MSYNSIEECNKINFHISPQVSMQFSHMSASSSRHYLYKTLFLLFAFAECAVAVVDV